MHNLYVTIFDPETVSVTELMMMALPGWYETGGRWENYLIRNDGICSTIAPFDEVEWDEMIAFNQEGHTSWHGQPDFIIGPSEDYSGYKSYEITFPEDFRKVIEHIKARPQGTRLAVYTIDLETK